MVAGVGAWEEREYGMILDPSLVHQCRRADDRMRDGGLEEIED